MELRISNKFIFDSVIEIIFKILPNFKKQPFTLSWYRFFLLEQCKIFWIFVNSKFSETVDENLKLCLHSISPDTEPANICLFKVNTWGARKRYEISSKLIIKTPERHYWRRSDFPIFHFEHISPISLFLVFLVPTLNKYMLTGQWRFSNEMST